MPAGAGAGRAIANSVDLARAAEGWGYRRHWLAEHHNAPGMACPSPEVMVGQVAAATSRIRVGAGGVMLPNHSPLRVAEAFRVLEALHPGRIDLGIGRAPGTDGVTAHALRRGLSEEDAGALLAELLAFGGEGFPAGHPYARVVAEPRDVPLPPIWVLASSEFGARLAAAAGLGLAFARYMNPRGTADAIRAYRREFRPGRTEAPRVILALSLVVADTAERAEELISSQGLAVVRMRMGRPGPLPTPEEALAHRYSAAEQDQLRRFRRAQTVGDPAGVRAQLEELLEATGADELMAMTMVHDHAARLRSYELLAEVVETLGPTRAAT